MCYVSLRGTEYYHSTLQLVLVGKCVKKENSSRSTVYRSNNQFISAKDFIHIFYSWQSSCFLKLTPVQQV